jgi:hypothetical protein
MVGNTLEKSGRALLGVAMRLRPSRRNLVVWSSSSGRFGRPSILRATRPVRRGRVRRGLYISAALMVMGVLRLTRARRAHWELTGLAAGAALTVTGLALSVAAAFFAGLGVLVITLLRGIKVNARSTGQAADCWQWHC